MVREHFKEVSDVRKSFGSRDLANWMSIYGDCDSLCARCDVRDLWEDLAIVFKANA
jgi:hypothetical protein